MKERIGLKRTKRRVTYQSDQKRKRGEGNLAGGFARAMVKNNLRDRRHTCNNALHNAVKTDIPKILWTRKRKKT